MGGDFRAREKLGSKCWVALSPQRRRPGKNILHQHERKNMNLRKTGQMFCTEGAMQTLSRWALDGRLWLGRETGQRGRGCPWRLI